MTRHDPLGRARPPGRPARRGEHRSGRGRRSAARARRRRPSPPSRRRAPAARLDHSDRSSGCHSSTPPLVEGPPPAGDRSASAAPQGTPSRPRRWSRWLRARSLSFRRSSRPRVVSGSGLRRRRRCSRARSAASGHHRRVVGHLARSPRRRRGAARPAAMGQRRPRRARPGRRRCTRSGRRAGGRAAPPSPSPAAPPRRPTPGEASSPSPRSIAATRAIQRSIGLSGGVIRGARTSPAARRLRRSRSHGPAGRSSRGPR